jgi:hypothetical protein
MKSPVTDMGHRTAVSSHCDTSALCQIISDKSVGKLSGASVAVHHPSGTKHEFAFRFDIQASLISSSISSI